MSLSLTHVTGVYFERLFAQNKTLSAAKAQVLLVDRFTMPIISMCYTQSQLLQQEVILVEMLDKQHSLSPMRHLNCVVYIKPEKESLAMLSAELRSPHYSQYSVFFSNSASKNDIEKLARADENEVVRSVVEVFSDYSVVNDNLFQVAVEAGANSTVHEAASLSSLLLSVKKCPAIRYEPQSLVAKRLASEMLYHINSNSNNNLFDDLNRTCDSAPVLVILDRKSDPITPLVTPWTYQSMIHELIGIDKNVVMLPESGEQLTLSEKDDFFRDAMYLNYGDLTDKFQQYVDSYKRQTKQSATSLQTQDLAELKKLLTRFPEFKKLSANILKHLNIISEIDKQISAQSLWAVGELQQTIVCGLDNHNAIRSKLLQVLRDVAVSAENKVKLLLLYTAKFPTGDMEPLVSLLRDPTLTNPPPPARYFSLVANFNRVFGAGAKNLHDEHTHDNTTNNNNNNIAKLFTQNKIKIQSLFNPTNRPRSASMPKTDNIFMQYIPPLHETLGHVTGHIKTPSSLSLLVPDTVNKQYGGAAGVAPQHVVVYFKGGATYEEARLIHEMSRMRSGISYVIGGDSLLDSSSWLERMCEMVE
ncbi:putative vacuolar protein sorting-associated protein [Clavispora lusitaniae]|uniref:Vacuolar protein sorting-associated protein n=1 Tax=Clavispora lusitaniae TaxID=36911 RepID=A0AA91T3K9_CLALS|nr:putative vacuolar protein sorting-associated protein [Clavispora lusitaniae]